MTKQLQSAVRAGARMFLVLAGLISGATHLNAQGITYPDFTEGGKVSTIQTNGSPAIAGDGTYVYVAFPDSTNNGNLTYGWSTDGANFVLYPTSIAMNSDPAITVDTMSSGQEVYIAFAGFNQDFYIYGFSQPNPTLVQLQDFQPGPSPYAVRPAILSYPDPSISGQDDLYLAWQGRVYDPSTGNYDGQWIVTSTTHYSGGVFGNFPTAPLNTNAVSEAYTAGSGPALALTGGIVYLTYLDAATGYPQLFTATQGSNSFTNTSGSGGIGGHYAGDPTMAVQNYYIYAGFRSAYQEDNLWVVGITDSGYGYGPSTGYTGSPQSISLTNSPSFAFTGGFASGTLYYAGRTNYPGSGPYAWIYGSPYSDYNPYDTTGGGSGGGDDGGGDDGGCDGGCSQ